MNVYEIANTLTDTHFDHFEVINGGTTEQETRIWLNDNTFITIAVETDSEGEYLIWNAYEADEDYIGLLDNNGNYLPDALNDITTWAAANK